MLVNYLMRVYPVESTSKIAGKLNLMLLMTRKFLILGKNLLSFDNRLVEVIEFLLAERELKKKKLELNGGTRKMK